MTTFTLQDLTPEQQTASENQALQDMAILGAGIPIVNISDGGRTVQYQQAPQHAPIPQPTLCESTQTDIPTIINTICAQLQLLSTVINQHQGNSPNTTPPEGNQSLQDTVALTLQQAEWFKEMVEKAVDDRDFEELVGEAVSNKVEGEVEHYFDYRFDPSDHFDFGDAVSDAVDDRLDDIVKEKIDECIEEVVAEKLSSANVSISF